MGGAGGRTAGAVVFTTHSIAHLNVFLTCNHTSITPFKIRYKMVEDHKKSSTDGTEYKAIVCQEAPFWRACVPGCALCAQV